MAHAILSASGASRWMACTPSAREEQKYESSTSIFAEEGTLAHELGELKLRHKLEGLSNHEYNLRLAKIQENELFNDSMIEYVEDYVEACMEAVAEARVNTPDALISIEQRLDFSRWVPKGFGTGDFVVIADGTMEIIDLKYGKGVPVSAVGNKQMRLYALGAINEFGFLYDIQKVKMTIVQPRLDSISSDEIDAQELVWWGNQIVKPLAEKAYKGEGEFCPGDHCKFCRAKAVCRARANKNLEMAQYEFGDPNKLSNDDIAHILHHSEELANWAKDVKEYALTKALEGEEFEGWKVVEGRANRKYTSAEEVEEILKNEGFEDIYKPRELLTITNMEKKLGKKQFGELLGCKVVKPAGKPTLALITDKREAYNPATADFK